VSSAHLLLPQQQPTVTHTRNLSTSFSCPTGKPYGLLSLLEEECSLGNATDLSYIAKIDKTFGTGKSAANKFYVKNKTRPDCFSVCHFAGAVEYNVAGFLDKNRDTLSVTAREVGVVLQFILLLVVLGAQSYKRAFGGLQCSSECSHCNCA
jgi:hypothetical protein